MIINQLFVKKPPYELLIKIIKAFGLNDINDNREFSHIDLDKHNTINNINNLEQELIECYIPCKRRNYIDNLQNITNKEIITIFRQILKAHNYDLYSKEKYIKGIKYLVYKIVTKQDKHTIHKTKKKLQKKEYVIVFD